MAADFQPGAAHDRHTPEAFDGIYAPLELPVPSATDGTYDYETSSLTTSG